MATKHKPPKPPEPRPAPAPAVPDAAPEAANALPAEPPAPAPAPPPKGPGPAVRITAAEEGVFGCAQRHPAAPRDYPAGHFSARQVAELARHPLLTVEPIAPEA